jgi:hypothetical protein
VPFVAEGVDMAADAGALNGRGLAATRAFVMIRAMTYRNAIWLVAMLAAHAQEKAPTTVSGSVAATLRFVEGDLLGAAEAMPESKYDYVPKDGTFEDARSFGEQLKHAACSHIAFFNEIEGKTPPGHCEKGGPSKARTKAELMAYLKESFDYGNRVLTSVDANPMAQIGGPYGGTNTKLGMAVLAVWHLSDHYGQLVLYLRMNGIVPPATKSYPLAVR